MFVFILSFRSSSGGSGLDPTGGCTSLGEEKYICILFKIKWGFFSEWWLLLFAYETLTSKTICIPTSLTKPAVFSGKLAGFDAATDRQVMDADRLGPLPSVPVKTIDWLLVFSVLFITGFTVYAILRTDSIRWLVPGQEHEHQDWKHNTRCDCKSLDVNDYLMNYLVCS